MNKLLFFTIRRLIYRMLYLADRITQRLYTPFVLCYHGVDESDWRFSVSFAMFKKQIAYLKRKGFTFVSTSDIAAYCQGKKILPHKSVALTFDDGYKSTVTVMNYLKKENITPTLFLLTNTTHPNWKEIGKKDSFLTVSEIKTLVKNGWIIGCHSSTHANLALLSQKDLVKEIVDAKKQLEQTFKSNITDFAYPRGKYNQIVINIVKEAGFTNAWTMDDDLLNKNINRFKIPRVGVDRSHSFSEFTTLFNPSAILFRKLVKNSWLGGFL